jgi:hypothetical protein
MSFVESGRKSYLSVNETSSKRCRRPRIVTKPIRRSIMKSVILFKNREEARIEADRRLNERRENKASYHGVFNALRPLIS